jgi:hypothetical protein
MAKKLGGIYEVEFPVVNRCRNGRYSTTPGRRACTRNGGVDRNYRPNIVMDDDVFSIPKRRNVDMLSLESDKRFEVLEAMKGNRYNLRKLELLTGRRKKDFNQRWYKLQGGKDPQETIDDLLNFNDAFDPWDDQEVLSIFDEMLQRNYSENMELLASGYTYNPEIFGARKNNNMLGWAILGLSIYALKKF